MNSTVSNFFSRDAMLKRQARTARSRKATLISKPLHIIQEEDEPRASSSRSPSPYASTSASSNQKAKRRHANVLVSDIRIARDAPAHLDTEEQDDSLLSAPRPAPRPPTSPVPSPDSFRLTFTDVSFKFPHPPLPTPSSDRHSCVSPTPSMSSSCSSSSPESDSMGLPTTPSSSDDEFSLPSPRFNPRRAAIKPLVIIKHSSSPPQDSPISHLESYHIKPTSPPPSPLSDSDSESDSEWYTREFSKILTLCSPIPPSFPTQNARPESMFIPPAVMPASPKPTGYPSGQLDPAFPRKRLSHERKRSIPKYAPPPPPVPPIPAHFRSNSISRRNSCSKTLPTTVRRPPPRSSVPADFDLADDESAFSFSMYADPESPTSAYSQQSFSSGGQEIEFPVDDLKFEMDMDYQLMLPLSLPGSPIDLEADIAHGLEELRRGVPELSVTEFVLEEEQKEAEQAQEVYVREEVQSHPLTPVVEEPQEEEEQAQDVFTSSSPCPIPASPAFSGSSAYSFIYPSPCSSPIPFDSPYDAIDLPERGLKSKWSSSTLNSIREEHELRGAAKLRLYFGGGGSPSKTKRTSKKLPQTPTSPAFSFSSSGHSPSPLSGKGRQSSRRESDVMVIGYGQTVGVRRRGSINSVSDAGSETSTSSSGSNGLRRKPIPVELFVRGGA
ncbi:hypothetical protein BDQ12DRAFT_735071 [Crucibulum laeve]|uniref:Uncharacterized protein n=1 Tax=Crucibulum laeve TaxID=68775 RepID=A0A5C3M3A3_9AGAR|nr:hypothetical protein BDQ12DRAFT_735071 [Crucibulum laeve]